MDELRGERPENKRFLNRVLNFMGIQEDDEQPFEDEQAAAGELRPTPDDGVKRRARLVSLPSSAAPGVKTAGMRVVVAEPKSFDEVQLIADHLKDRRPVIVSLEAVDRELSKRIIDFMSGTCYALDGNIQRIGDDIFIFTPSNVSIDGEMTDRWRDRGIFS